MTALHTESKVFFFFLTDIWSNLQTSMNPKVYLWVVGKIFVLVVDFKVPTLY